MIAADRRTVAADKFRRRMNDDVRAMFDRSHEVRARECVVDDERNAVLMGDFRHRFDVQNVAARIADRLGIERLGLRRNRFAEIFRIGRIDEFHVNADFFERNAQTSCTFRRTGWKRIRFRLRLQQYSKWHT